jgi:hypothetical protein
MHAGIKPGARRTEFVEAFQSDLPCPDLLEKIFPFTSDPNHLRIVAIPSREKGRIMIVTDVGMGCGGRGSVVARDCCRASHPLSEAREHSAGA